MSLRFGVTLFDAYCPSYRFLDPNKSYGKDDNSTYDVCVDDVAEGNISLWIGVFILAQMLYGYVGPSIWIVGITYMDDNCKNENSVLYLGIFNAMSSVGVMLGFIGGGFSLGVYVDYFKIDMDTLEIDASDPRWVGAWWIGFAAAFILSIPLVIYTPCFPRIMPDYIDQRKERSSHTYKGAGVEETQRKDFGKSCGDVGESILVLIKNPVFVLITLGAILELGNLTAMAAFLPKVIQFQYGQTPQAAALISGGILVPGAIIGMLLGGIIPKVGKFSVKQTVLLQLFKECQCIPRNITLEDGPFQAHETLCHEDCDAFKIFMPMYLLLTILTFVENTPGQATIMRVVPEKQRSFAFGFQTPFYKLLGTIPIPILYGYAFDKSCDIWQEGCGERGSCWVYDTDGLAVGLCIAHIVVKSVSGSCFMAAAFAYKPPPPEEVLVKTDKDVDYDQTVVVVAGAGINGVAGYSAYEKMDPDLDPKPANGVVSMGHVNASCDCTEKSDYCLKL